MIDKAFALVREYIDEHLEPNPDAQITLIVVWQCRVLQNFKCLIYATLPGDMYFEVTYNGDREVWYLDAYRKIENRVVKDELH